MMTPDRFIALTEAYGADRRRWPDAERASAEAFAAARPDVAARALADAGSLDDLLFASRPPVPSAALRERVIASAVRRRVGWMRDRLALTFGAGWAAAACAGIVFGLVAVQHTTADARADAVLYQASLSGVDDLEVLS